MATPVRAQVKVGDNLSMNMNGQISAGYTADYGNFIQSDHGFTFGGNVDLTGSYYSPGFLSFNINPFYNQSRANSNFQSIFDSSGVNLGASIFSGSHFPGTINYSKLYTSAGTFGLPGLPNYTTHGNSDALGVTWSELIPDAPSVSASYQQGSSNYTAYGESSSSTTDFHSLNISSAYQLAGFSLNGGYNYSNSHSQFPAFLASAVPEESSSYANTIYVAASHRLPLDGTFSGSYTHSSYNSNYIANSEGTPTTLSGSVNVITGNAFFHPVDNLSTGASAIYTDNLLGSLFLPIINGGGGGTQVIPEQSTHSLNFNEYANYLVNPHVTVSAYAQQLSQNYVGGSISSQAYTGTVDYTNTLWGGNASILGGITANSTNAKASGTAIGAIGSFSYTRDFGNWGLAGSLNYAQNTQTALAGYTTSSLGYSGNVARRLGNWHWTGLASGSHTLLTHTGYSDFNQTYSTALSGRWIGVNANYTRVSGNAIVVGSGLVPTPIPPVALPSEIIFYGGTGWGVGIGATPIRRLSMTATYANSRSNTGSLQTFSNNTNETFVATIQYQFRQLYLNGGYVRLVQGFSTSSLPPTMLGSWYVGIQRWFNFF